MTGGRKILGALLAALIPAAAFGTIGLISDGESGLSVRTKLNSAISELNALVPTTGVAHQWIASINSSGAATLSRPACGDLSDAAASCATDATNAGNISAGTLPSGRLVGAYSGVTAVGASGVTAATYGSATQVAQVAVGADGRVTSAANVTISGSSPGGAAGGDLAGTYPNPTVAKVNGVAYGTSPSGNTVPVVTGVNSVTYEAVPNAALANSSVTISGHGLVLGGTLNLVSGDVGLGNVTNDAQTKAAIVPNTAPTAGQLLVGNAGGTAYAPVSLSGDCALSSLGAITCTKTSGVAFAASATTDTTNAANISSGNLPAARMSTNLSAALDSAFSSTQGSVLYRGLAGWAALGPGTSGQFLQTAGAAANPLWASVSAVAGGAAGQIQYNNAGLLGGFTASGDATINTSTGAVAVSKTGGVAFAASATTDTTNASNISSGTLAAARGGAGTITGALKANGSGLVSQAACADLSNGGTYCSATQGQLPGVTSNTAASAGNIGQVISSTVAIGSAVALTNVVAANMTSISVTAGEWLIYCECQFNGTAATGNAQFTSSISTTSATFGSDINQNNVAVFNLGNSAQSAWIGPVYVSLAGTTTYYGVVRASFTGGAIGAYGTLFAVRLH